MTGEVICGGEREKRGANPGGWRAGGGGGRGVGRAGREEQDIRGGGVLTEFELIRQQNLSLV